MTWKIVIELPEERARALYAEIFDRSLNGGAIDMRLYDDKDDLRLGWMGNTPDSAVFKHGRNL